MASEGGDAPDPVALLAALAADPHRFDFYQALRRLEAAWPDAPHIGEARRLREEPVRLAQEVSLTFAPSALAALELREARNLPPRLRVAFFGLFGPNGPLPVHLTEYAHTRMLHAGDHTFARFADIFHHRLLSIFYRIWARANPVVSQDRGDDQRFARYVGAFAGLGRPALAGRDSLSDAAKYAHVGLLSRATASASGLASILGNYFRVPVRIEEFTPHWMALPADSLTRLGRGDGAELGFTAVIGDRVWDLQSRFRIVIGPLTLEQYQRFLPSGSSFQRLVDWVLNYCGLALAWDCRLILNRREVPRLELGRRGRLGWTTWLGQRAPEADADELLLRPGALRAGARARGSHNPEHPDPRSIDEAGASRHG